MLRYLTFVGPEPFLCVVPALILFWVSVSITRIWMIDHISTAVAHQLQFDPGNQHRSATQHSQALGRARVLYGARHRFPSSFFWVSAASTLFVGAGMQQVHCMSVSCACYAPQKSCHSGACNSRSVQTGTCCRPPVSKGPKLRKRRRVRGDW